MRKKVLPQGSSSEYKKLRSKWQIALRRYVLEEKNCPEYAPFFGLPIYLFRAWIETQLESGLSWENFSSEWQFDHVVPTTYFDLTNREELLLCWNFINIRVEKVNKNKSVEVDVLGAKAYFQHIFNKSGYSVSLDMVRKIEAIEKIQIQSNPGLELFISNNHDTISALQTFGEGEFERVNWGLSVQEVVMENNLLNKFGK